MEKGARHMDLKLFTTPGCTPCIAVKRFAEAVPGCQIIDLRDQPEYTEQYSLTSTPTLIINNTEVITVPNLIIERLQGLV